MPNCIICGKSVVSGIVAHKECYDRVKKIENTDIYKTILENAKLKIKLHGLEKKIKSASCNDKLSKEDNIIKKGISIEIPCKIGETVYVLENVHKRKKIVDVKISPYIVDNIVIAETVSINLCNSANDWLVTSLNDFGVSVFTTIDEAQKEAHQ